MKKALTILALSLLLFEGILAYDAIMNDGHAFSLLLDQGAGDEQINIVKAPGEAVLVDPSTLEPREDIAVKNTVEINEEMVDETGDEQDSSGDDYEMDADDGASADKSVATNYEYYYNQLSDKEKKVYRVMVDAFTAIESGNTIETLNDDSMNRVATAVRDDHPELFYVEEMGYTQYMLGGQIQRTVLNVTYTDSEAAIRSKQGLIDTKVKSILNGISPSASDYEKTKYVYETVIKMTEYDANAPESQNIISVFINGRSVCAGFTRATQYLLNLMGVPATMVEGTDLEKHSPHAWNLVKCDGQFYYIDATWGDTSYKSMEGNADDGGINYGYLNITSDELLRNHSIKAGFDMPKCSSTENNYYVKEGLYLYTYDEAQIEQLFNDGYNNGKRNVSFKCASIELYDEMVNKLVNNQKIFDYVRVRGTVSYSVDEDERTLCFWL